MNDQLVNIEDKINSLQRNLDILSNSLDSVRAEEGEARIRLGGLESQIDELRKVVHDLPSQVQNQVIEAIQPLLDTAETLTTTIEKKKVVPVNPPKTPWYKRFSK